MQQLEFQDSLDRQIGNYFRSNKILNFGILFSFGKVENRSQIHSNERYFPSA